MIPPPAQTKFNYELKLTPAQQRVFPRPDRWGDVTWRYMIVPKGRRTGITQGAEKSIIGYGLAGITPMLWVDTINGNIDRYFERYFRPDLNRLPKGWWTWNANKRILMIRNRAGGWSIIDFRSADNPQSIEGFGYKLIFLNEAGIILNDEYLYSQAILPMLVDFPDSKLIAAGVPKGKTKKDGTNHKFFDLREKAASGAARYALVELTSFDNPLLEPSDIDEIILELSAAESEQEIYGQFVDMAGRNPFAHQYDPVYHESELALFRPGIQLIIAIDFNLNPFAVTFGHIWKDALGLHDHTFDEASIPMGSVRAMIDLIKNRYSAQIPNCMMTGDTSTGNQGQQSLPDLASYFKQLKSGLRLRDTQMILPGVPTHRTSREDVNYILYHSKKVNPEIDYKINPKTCPQTARDMRVVQADAFGDIIKKDRKDVKQRADFMDAQRYKINAFWKKWIVKHQRQSKFRTAS